MVKIRKVLPNLKTPLDLKIHVDNRIYRDYDNFRIIEYIFL